MHFRRFFRPLEGQHFFLFGPRGTGKSTWLKETFPEALYVNLLKPEQLRFYSAKPERLQQSVKAFPEKNTIIIDEIQLIPELLPQIHDLIEEKKEITFILAASSGRKLKKEGVNLLGGRATLYHMPPFFAAELGSAFSLEKALEYGMLPVVWGARHPQAILKGYVGVYLKEEVHAEAVVRSLSDFSRFLEVISFSHASSLNTTNIARECDISRPTVEHYLGIIQDMFLAFTLPVFTKRAKREVVGHPRFYLFDSGVFLSLRPRGPFDKATELRGLALEGLVAQHLRAWCFAQKELHQLYFWRTRTGLEVDFVIYGPRGFWAIEVKHAHRLSSDDFSGLKAFCEEYPEAQPLMVYNGEHRLVDKNILCIPCEEFLKRIVPDELIFFQQPHTKK